MNAPVTPATDRTFRLPEDLEIVPAPQIDGMSLHPDDVLVARRHSRQTPVVLSADTVALLEGFKDPRTLADGILLHSGRAGRDPIAMLQECFPVLQQLARIGLLVGTDDQPEALRPRFQPGAVVGLAICDRMIRLVTDTEIWQGHLAADPARKVAIKVIDTAGIGPTLLDAEDAALRVLEGNGAPAWLACLRSETGGTLISDWIEGEPIDLAGTTPAERARLAYALVQRYADLHRRDVLHGDPHPGNAVLTADGAVMLLDFGLAHVPGQPRPPRPSGGESLDPQSAAQLMQGRQMPEYSQSDELYAIAVMAYRIVCGAAYLDLETERSEALRRIVEQTPRSFAVVGGPRWPAGERVLRRALAKDPTRRYPDASRFASALGRALRSPVQPGSSADALPDEVSPVVADLDVGGRWWPTGVGPSGGTRREDAAAAAWFLRRAAELVADSDCADLAAVWSAIAGSTGIPVPAADSPVAAVHRCLGRFRRTGAARDLAAARRAADRVGALPDPGVPSVLAGPMASVLVRLECADPWQSASVGLSV
ncbi:MAG TPA: AarF/UbiB family protein [Nakamurella sp.]